MALGVEVLGKGIERENVSTAGTEFLPHLDPILKCGRETSPHSV